MIEDWDIPVARSGSPGASVQVAAVVPLPSEQGGAGELLVLSAFGNMRLPTGDVQPRETSLQAVARVALSATGVQVSPERLVYVVEQPGKPLMLCVLCTLVLDEEVDTKPGVRFANIGAVDGDFDPSPLRQLLIEDLRSEFARGVAHIAINYDESGRMQASVTW